MLSYGSGGGTVYTRLWYPDGLEVIRGVLVFTDGGAVSSGDTRGITGDAFWQRFAAHFGFALLGNQFTTHYKDAEAHGSGQGLLDSLAGLAGDTHHPELVHAPLVLKGTSNGGYFSFTFAHWQPARVIAFCVNKSGYTTAPLDAPLLATPGLLVWGSAETAATPTIIHSLVQQGRALHALWAEVKEWGRDHEEGTPQQLYAPFFAEMIAARYPTSADPRAGDVALLALTEESGWLGDHADASVESNLPTIAAYADYTGDKLAASWLPSRSLATLWRGFVTKTPATLSAPALGAALEVDQASLLRATGLADGERARFLVGSMPLGAAIAATAGEATFSWTPSASSATAVIAVVEDGSGTPLRTTRPAQVVTYRTPPVAPMAGQGGSGGMAGSQAGTGGSAGSDPAADSGGIGGTGGAGGEAGSENGGADAAAGNGEPPEEDETAAPDGGSTEPDAGVEEPPSAGSGGSGPRSRKRDQRVSGGGGCSIHGPQEQGSSAMAAGLAVCLVSAARRRRRASRL